MPNTLLTIGMVTRELLDCFENNLVWTKHIERKYSSEFARPGDKVGPSINIRLPAQLRTQSGPNLSVQDYVEQSSLLTIDQQEHVDVQFSSFEMTLSLDEWRTRIGKPSGIVLANVVDAYGCGLYWQVPNAILSPATGTDKWLAYLQAGALLADNGCPADGEWYAVLNQWEQAAVINGNKALFESSPELRRQYERGLMGQSAGLTWAWDQNIAAHTTGPRGGASQTYVSTVAGGASINVAGFTAAAALRLKKGDIFTLGDPAAPVAANVFAVNPVTRLSTGKLRQFTVTADVSSAADGTAVVPISPAIIGPATPANPRQTVDKLPTGGQVMTFLGAASTTYFQNEVLNRQAFAMGMCRLQEPFSGQSAYAVDSDTGVAIRTWKASDISTDSHASRADIAFGMCVPRPMWCCRVWSIA